ncbi:YdcF family protein [Glaciimonas sp. PCH181]|uniref:YdcF family protein n=1 Tax=Glaciimonas sp. PCH181 TaxID=2133943 RepID=UPI000D39C9AA|nr:YdcF family protein [Glaciimonas sp. PCH181]PUA20513.1 YdcF family protein [Glaciimonas sp. PCH181]
MNTLIGTLFLPPTSLILLCCIGFFLYRRWPRFGMSVSAIALLVLLIISTSAGALLFVAPLENQTPVLNATSIRGAQAIVVLGGGRLQNAPEYGGVDSPSYWTLARLRYAARLHRETGLPVLVAGGKPDGGNESEAVVMARSLREDFATPVKWLEETSNNSAQNAAFSQGILARENVGKILLVTDAIHMPRAKMIFQQSGLEVVAAPTIFFSHDKFSISDFVPSGEGLRRSYYALHEWIGIAWYKLRY